MLPNTKHPSQRQANQLVILRGLEYLCQLHSEHDFGFEDDFYTPDCCNRLSNIPHKILETRYLRYLVRKLN
jgi:hypothetical protein